jgi:hypothetical protein
VLVAAVIVVFCGGLFHGSSAPDSPPAVQSPRPSPPVVVAPAIPPAVPPQTPAVAPAPPKAPVVAVPSPVIPAPVLPAAPVAPVSPPVDLDTVARQAAAKEAQARVDAAKRKCLTGRLWEMLNGTALN